jgi:uncharacterized damage-inducible protein DinB
LALNEALLSEFDYEANRTRKTLERVQEEKFDWKPHEKSMTLGRLSQHLAELPGWMVLILEHDSFDMAPPGAPPPKRARLNSRTELLDLFDKSVATARAAIAATTDDCLLKPWSLLSGGTTILTMPRIAVLRRFVVNHTVHHRGQLCVYLRLNNLPVPALYGPSADEKSM